MPGPYKLYGAELSPYSQKVRAFLSYAGIPFEWLNRSNARAEEIQRYAKLPLLPILVGSEDDVTQDSTPILEKLAAENPVLAPSDPAAGFLAALIEDYADEWLNKVMYHYRWSNSADRESAAERIVAGMFEGEEIPNKESLVAAVCERMSSRLRHVGSNPESAPILEGSFERLIGLLEPLLQSRSYLFGGRPSLADFGLAAQLDQMLSDPTAGSLLRDGAPKLISWLKRMRGASGEGEYLPFETLAADFAPLLKAEIAALYLPWMSANAEAVARDANGVEVMLEGRRFGQAPQRYAVKAFAELRRKHAGVESEPLAALLEETGCAAFFGGAGDVEADDDEDDGESED